MLIRTKMVLVALCALPTAFPSQAQAAGECATKPTVREQLICVEKKIDSLKVPQLPPRFKLRSERGWCLTFRDREAAPLTQACSDPTNQYWNITQ
jgi:hypothetical protein